MFSCLVEWVGEIPILLGPLEKPNLIYWIIDLVWLILTLSKKPTKVGDYHTFFEYGNKSSFQKIVCDSYLEFRTIDSTNAAILNKDNKFGNAYGTQQGEVHAKCSWEYLKWTTGKTKRKMER